MKTTLLTALLFILFSLPTTAQQMKGVHGEKNWFTNWTNFKPTAVEYDEPNQIITGNIIKNTTLTKENVYQLIGSVYVINNAILTIEPGTVIRGDKNTCGTLVITKGSKIIADGTATNPIIFTSNNEIGTRKPGDWGGIVILGEAPINKIGGVGFLDFNFDPALSRYGGEDTMNNSGILRYVRIEFSGRKINALKELNGLSLAGVGKGTKLDFIQISFSNDDSFECYGGDVLFNNLISYRATDDDFDFTQGAQCIISNSLAIRNPFSSDISGSRCFEIDSYDKIENFDTSKKSTKISANNISLINTEENNQGLVREAIFIKEKSYLNLNNSIISGFTSCVLLEKKITTPMNYAKINIQNLQSNQCGAIVESENSSLKPEIINWYNPETYSIETTNLSKSDLLLQADIKKSPDYRAKMSQMAISSN